MVVEGWNESVWADVIVRVAHDRELLGHVARENRQRSNDFEAATLDARRVSFFAERIRAGLKGAVSAGRP
jgi:hypothetical protein